ncbi:MAG: phytoene desaturase family protein, partial [Parvibaculaceae bacterium]
AFVQGTLRPEIVEELALSDFGLEMTSPDVQGLALFPDGSHFFLWKDLDRTLRELERYSREDARGLIEFGARFLRFEEIIRPFRFTATPPSRGAVIKAFDDAGEAELFNDFVLSSTRNLLDKYFVSEHIKGLLTLYGLVSVWAGPDTPEGAYVYGYHAAGEFERTVGRWAFVKGGMGGITQSLALAAQSRGVDVLVSAPVEEILVSSGRISGVRLKRGETLHSRIVVSNAHPKLTFLKLLAEKHLDRRFRERVGQIDTKGSMARIHLLVDRLPHYVGFGSDKQGPQHEGLAVLGCTVDNFQKAFAAQMAGAFCDDYAIELVIQSAIDPTLAPKGLHTITLGVQNTPFKLVEGDWDSRKEAWGDHVCEMVFRYAPNLRGHVLGRHIITPLDLEREYGLVGGNIFHLPLTLEYAFDARPLPNSGGYRTPVPGLYLCGAGTYPGGAVTGIPGRNAAHAVLEDRAGLKVSPPRAARKGFLDRVLESEIGGELGYRIARSRLLRPVTRYFSNTRRD